MPFKYLKWEQNETFHINFRREFLKFAEVRGDRHGRGTLRTSESGVPRSPIKILNIVALIQEIKSFGYTSNGDVKERYHSCMMKGKVEKICSFLTWFVKNTRIDILAIELFTRRAFLLSQLKNPKNTRFILDFFTELKNPDQRAEPAKQWQCCRKLVVLQRQFEKPI